MAAEGQSPIGVPKPRSENGASIRHPRARPPPGEWPAIFATERFLRAESRTPLYLARCSYVRRKIDRGWKRAGPNLDRWAHRFRIDLIRETADAPHGTRGRKVDIGISPRALLARTCPGAQAMFWLWHMSTTPTHRTNTNRASPKRFLSRCSSPKTAAPPRFADLQTR